MKSNSLLSLKEVSHELKEHEQTTRKRLKWGEIRYIKKGRRYLVSREALNEFIEQRSQKANPILDLIPRKFDLQLDHYDRLFLKGGVKMSSKGKKWNYPFGSVYLRQSKSGKERWYIYYRVDGKRVREVVKNALSRADALKVLHVKVADAFRGKYGFKKEEKTEDALFEDFGKEFLGLYSRVKWKPKTVRGHENSLRHLNRFFKGKRLSDINPESMARYLAERKTKVSASSVNRELSCL